MLPIQFYSNNCKSQSRATHQSLVSEGVVHTPHEEPKRPEVLKSELKHKVCQQHQSPHNQELQVQEGTGQKRSYILDREHTRFHTMPVDNEIPLYS